MIDPKKIPKYISNLLIPPVFLPKCKCNNDLNDDNLFYDIDILETKEQMLPDSFPETKVFGYGGRAYFHETDSIGYYKGTPGGTFLTYTDEDIYVKWNNKIKGKHMFAVDPTLHWANPNNMIMPPPKPWPTFPPGFPKAQFPVPVVTHLHGGETESKFDGFPDSWFTYNGLTGPAYETNVYHYLNEQQSSNLFYHDHALGMTRLNVYAGLSGAYIIKDLCNPLDCPECSPLPQGKYDIPLMIQDKSFNDDGSLYFPSNGINPDTHPYWRPSFFGDTNVVNGKVWPKFDVERRAYRFRLINGANSRFYKFKLTNGARFIQIGSDSGYLERPVYLNEIILSPAERADVIIDFSNIKLNSEVLLLNTNEDADPETTGQVMKFNVKYNSFEPPLKLPNKLNTIPKLKETVSKRIVVLNAATNTGGLLALLLNGQPWSAPVSEKPIIGSTQVWEIVNISNGPHPIHIHLIDFQVLNRQNFDKNSYSNDWNTINGPSPLTQPTKVIDPTSYLIGKPILPPANERGWKDTVIAYPNQVTRIIVPMYPSNIDPECAKPGLNLFPFDPTEEPGYVWHCHLLDHEDNEMMRPMKVIK